jgi:uncharacterized protein
MGDDRERGRQSEDRVVRDRTIRTQQEETGMQNAHMSALELKHATLDARISEENQRPHPDMTTLARLKKEKLKVKEAICGI